MASTVADAAVLLTAMAGADPADPASEAAAAHATDYASFLNPAGLDGARIGVWRAGAAQAGAATIAVLDAALAVLRGHGAVVVDPVELADADRLGEPEFAAMTHEFKHDLNAYLAALPGEHPATLAELIRYNMTNAGSVLACFGQDLFERAEATSGDLADAAYLAARGEADRLARAALGGALDGQDLDAVASLTGGPARLTDHLLGDLHEFHSATPAAVSGYPSISVPAGDVAGLPVGLTLAGRAWGEPRLLALAYAFEQAARL
jgi:amidase